MSKTIGKIDQQKQSNFKVNDKTNNLSTDELDTDDLDDSEKNISDDESDNINLASDEDIDTVVEDDIPIDNEDELEILDLEEKDVGNIEVDSDDESVEHVDVTTAEEETDGKIVKCAYDYIEKPENDDDIAIDIIFDDDNKVYSGIVKKENRITKPVYTKYERVRLLCTRTKQLSLGAKPMVKDFENKDPKYIAEFEIKNKIIPFKIHRHMPSGETEEWRSDEMSISN